MRTFHGPAIARAGSAGPETRLRLSDLIAAFSHALDLTDGEPPGHSVRCCYIGMHVGRAMGLDDEALWALYYTLLLKDLGCSSNAARICQLYVTDDHRFKRNAKRAGASKPSLLRFVLANTAPDDPWHRRLRALVEVVKNSGSIARELIQTRCTRGADIARQLGFPESVADAVHGLDEHFDGSGYPEGRSGDAIPVGSRIALLAQVVDVFQFSSGAEAALSEVRSRAGTWFDPVLVRMLEQVGANPLFWQTLAGPGLERVIRELEPRRADFVVDEAYLDAIAQAFGSVVDAKSAFTAGHSHRVAHLAEQIAQKLGMPAERRRWLWRGALLHDVGKLGVSNSILDKPGKLDPAEWQAVQRHAAYTEQILARVPVFAELAPVAAAHHERLDGTGYPEGLQARDIALETRIITVADIFDAISSERPYHSAMPAEATLCIMRKLVGTAIDGDCLAALEAVLDAGPTAAEVAQVHWEPDRCAAMALSG